MTDAARRIGLVLAREAYYHEFIDSLERGLAPAGIAVLVRVVPDRAAETAVYRRWAAARRVDGVILVDMAPGDERAGLAGRLGMPAVLVGDVPDGLGQPAVRTDDAGCARQAVGFLAGLGHRLIGHVSGPLTAAHTRLRRSGFETETRARGLRLVQVEGDYSYDRGVAATATLLVEDPAHRPTALVFGNDVMAIGGLQALAARRLRVPADVSVVAWDDSALCRLATPPLTAMSHHAGRIGGLAATAMLDALAGRPATVHPAPPAHIVVRDSTAAR
ncbi:DNA-binding LacI/PurR family transcriptional regulator [Actinoplanes octamycinicus]|uniref:DNA-binding LacI/PurR family transcriptional regulator n=1 Tax=Actinoplanes octamycinicus TaxID=135948 RepID=A0A7W7MCI3_9ACTN|nr:substrate-binding domain-containing protein [Actinoplanes octamycinicus]MBB4745128.1 DNA-binding LacI/PurR family transcriptional regulator [Actinoplanes octamycinicus]